jgi:hypothetical protein
MYVMSNQDRGDTDTALDFPNFHAHGFAQLGVKIAERFVEQQQIGFDDKRSCKGHALLLAAGQMARISGAEAGKMDKFERLLHLLVNFLLLHTTHLQPECDVLGDRQVWKKRVILKYQRGIAGIYWHAADIPALEAHIATVGSVDASDGSEQRCLPASGRAKQREEFPFCDGKRDAVDRNH